MALPTYVGSGALGANAGALTPAFHASTAVDDIALLVVESENEAISLSSAQGFVEVGSQANKAAGPAATQLSNRIAVYWKRITTAGGGTAPTIADAGDHVTAALHSFRGCIATGDPWSDIDESLEATSDGTVVIPGGTTDVDDCLVVLICGCSRNVTASGTTFSAWANADLANILERFDETNTIGLGGGHGMATGEKATAGTFTTTTATVSPSTMKGLQMIALKPPAGAQDFPLDAQPGSYALTGSVAGVPAGRAVNAAPGSLAVTGQAAGVPAGRVVSASPGSYAVAGLAASFLRGLVLGATPGAYSLSGAAAAVGRELAFSADPGAYVLTGSPAGALAGRAVLAAPGAYALTGSQAGLLADRLLGATPGVYTLAGFAADLLLETPGAFELNADPGAYALAGTSAGLLADRLAALSPGSYALAGAPASAVAGRVLSAAAGSLAVTGAAAEREVVRALVAAAGAYALSGAAASFEYESNEARTRAFAGSGRGGYPAASRTRAAPGSGR